MRAAPPRGALYMSLHEGGYEVVSSSAYTTNNVSPLTNFYHILTIVYSLARVK
jgi:hypothetical protein